jgi:hypothetical protein
VKLLDAGGIEWNEVTQLLLGSYVQVASKRGGVINTEG